MDIVIIDGQGGGFGRALIEALRAGGVTQEIVAVGTNALATSAMLRRVHPPEPREKTP